MQIFYNTIKVQAKYSRGQWITLFDPHGHREGPSIATDLATCICIHALYDLYNISAEAIMVCEYLE